jgi:translocation and assembly module TamB
MPDSEKLSWIVLGRGQDSAAGSDLSLLATAASALLGGEGEGITGSLAQALGLDQIALTQATTSTGPRSQVVSTSGSTTTVGGQVVSVGKRLTSNALLTYEQGVAGATSIVKLTWNLSRRLALIGSTGTEQAVDVRYVFSFK